MRSLKLSPEQAYEICMIIGQWYLHWKTKDINRNFGYAKEELKTIICEGLHATEFSKRDSLKLLPRDEPLKTLECARCKKRCIDISVTK